MNASLVVILAAVLLPGQSVSAQSKGAGQIQVTHAGQGKVTALPQKAARKGGGSSLMAAQFEDVSSNMGPTWTGPSFGAGAWGDFDGDGWPDFWQSNHAKHPTILLNNCDGTFQDVSFSVVTIPDPQDAHGLAWADYDADGDLDLIELVGAESGLGSGPNQVWQNDNGTFTEVAVSLGLDFPTGRGRTPLWLDWNGDGRLDLLATNFVSAFSEDKLYTQTALGAFVEEDSATGFVPSGKSSHYAQLADFDADGVMDVHIEGNIFPGNIYTYNATTWTDITSSLGLFNIPDVVDSAAGDFNRDGIVDFYLARDPFWKISQVGLDKNGTMRAELLSDQNEIGFTFDCKGPILVDMDLTNNLGNVFLGSAGSNPSAPSFTLSHKDDISGGLYNRQPGDAGIYIGREFDSNTWKITVYTPSRVRVPMIIRSVEPITNIAEIGFPSFGLGADLILDHGSGDWAGELIWADQFRGSSVVTGDFDNDMDLDLYVVRTGPAVNLANKLFENDGTGQFTPVDTAGGASGVLLGVGDGVSMVDYDLDGFLDLYITNGRSGGILAQSGHHQLFHNTGNANHWIEIDLVGTTSNIHGIGARVLVTTSDGVQQLREQGGGMHRSTQNHSRLHFGLGPHTMIDLIEIRWPSGIVQTLANVPVDQIMDITEQ